MFSRATRGASTCVGDRNAVIWVTGAAGSPACRTFARPVLVRTPNTVFAFVALYTSTLTSSLLPATLKNVPARRSSVGSQGSSKLPRGSAFTVSPCLVQLVVTVAVQVGTAHVRVIGRPDCSRKFAATCRFLGSSYEPLALKL